MVFRNTNPFWAGKIKQVPDFAESMREVLSTRFDWLNHELSTREYLAGPRFTVADITALCAIDFGRVNKTRLDPETHPHLAAWHARVSARPSTKA
jgi:glutathione S-transferase